MDNERNPPMGRRRKESDDDIEQAGRKGAQVRAKLLTGLLGRELLRAGLRVVLDQVIRDLEDAG